jgi:hypothetical protein
LYHPIESLDADISKKEAMNLLDIISEYRIFLLKIEFLSNYVRTYNRSMDRLFNGMSERDIVVWVEKFCNRSPTTIL